MANEKTLNTRIVLKHDPLSTWLNSKYNKTPENGGEYLKNGEIAVVTLGENKDNSTATNNNNHPVLFKVGTGEHIFNDLPFASALAADVYAWAKKSEVEFTTWVNTIIDFGGYYTKEEINNLIANYSTTAQMEAAIKVETDRAIEVEDGLEERIAELEDAVGTEGSVSEAIKAAIEALDSSASQAAGADGLALSITETDGKITAISGSIAANTYDAYGSAATAKSEAIAAAAEDATTKANAAQAAAEGKVTELANGQVNTNKEAIADIVDGTTPVAKATDADELGGTAAADYALKTYADQAEADAVATAKAYTDEMKNSILGEGISETFDTLKEIQTWIEGAGVNATELTEAIAAEAKAREDGDALKVDKTIYEAYIVGKSMSDEELKAYTDGKFTEANLDQYTTEAEVKVIKVDNAVNAEQLGGTAAANYALKTEAQGYANTAEQNAKDYADSLTQIGDGSAMVSAKEELVNISGNMSVAISSRGVLNINCGGQNIDFAGDGSGIAVTGDMQVQDPVNNSSVSTKKYVDDALAAAKEYADSNDTDTLYEAGEGLTLDLDEKGNNVFSIDDSLTWIFDCGTSTN